MAGKRRIVGEALRARFDAARSLDDVKQLADEFISAIELGADLRSLGWPRSMYGVSKLCEATWSRILASELASDSITVSACCPGWCSTSMSSFSGPNTPEQGADTPVWLALAPPGELPSGRFWSGRQEENF
jgi:carbonyl reductase 1